MSIFSRDDQNHLSANDLPLNDDGMPMPSVRQQPPKEPHPDIIVSFLGVSMHAYLTPGPYSPSDATKLLKGCEMLIELIQEQTREADEPRIGRGNRLSLSEPNAEAAE